MPSNQKPRKIQAKSTISFSAPVKIRARAEGDSPTRTFELVAYSGEAMNIHGYANPVVVDCSNLDLSQQTIPALYDHCPDESFIVGQINEISVGAGGTPPIVARGIFTPSDESDYCAKVLRRADAGYQWQTSVGGEPASVEDIKPGETVTVNGREYTGPISIARGLVLREISFVVLGGDRRTKALVARRSKLRANSMTFEEWLVSLGFADQSGLDEVQLANLKQLFSNEYPEEGETAPTTAEGEEPETPENPADEMTGEDKMEEELPTNAGAKKAPLLAGKKKVDIKAERQRIRRIEKICARYGNPQMTVHGRKISVADHAIQAGLSEKSAELLAMRNENRRKHGPVVHVSGGGSTSKQSLEGALILRAGGRLDHPGYQGMQSVGLLPPWMRASINDSAKNQIMDLAHQLAKKSAVDICAEALRANGKSVPHDRDDMIRAAFSTGSLGNVMTTSVNAILMATYMDFPDSTVGGWVIEQDVNNYLLQERPRVLKGQSLTLLPEGGTADHDYMSDVVETYKVKRFARQFSVDEIAIINDNLGAIREKPVEMGMAAARLRPDLVWATIAENPTLTATARSFFNATDGNLLTSKPLSSANITAATAAMTLFRENSVNLNIMPTHIAVPPSLKDTCRTFIGSDTIVIAGSTDTTKGSLNPHKDWNLGLVFDPRMENGITHPVTGTAYAGSATTWYLFSAWAPSLEIGYLAGSGRAPRVRSWSFDKEGKFGQGWDISHTIGICVRDWKGALKCTA